MFELSIAFKYLAPRWRQLSVSIISLISIFVIALVVWLVVVFFSVTYGLEKSWVQRLIALTAPVRITPTPAYYNSYYYLIDQHSVASGYAPKSITEKLQANNTDPYDPAMDGDLPETLPLPDNHADGNMKDLVKTAFQTISTLPNVQGLSASPFEVAITNLQMQLDRFGTLSTEDTILSQTAYIGPFDQDNHTLVQAILPTTTQELSHLLRVLHKHYRGDAYLTTYFLRTKWINKSTALSALPTDPLFGEAILVPKSFRQSGVSLGDRGFLSYYAPTMSSIQEQRIPYYVAGFYDPGIIPIGGKYILANPEVISLVRSATPSDGNPLSNGINVRFNDIAMADQVKSGLQHALKQAGVDRYWTVETYRDYEFTRDLIQQLRSERNLWTLLSTVIIIVACSNIISMLIILVNNKRLEIGILRAMGASSFSIALIFGICGMVMGMAGSFIGIVAALLTLYNLQSLVDFIGHLQGYEMFNPLFYGDTLPNQLSPEALLFVVTTTACISLVAGVVPALKASLMRPSTILRAE